MSDERDPAVTAAADQELAAIEQVFNALIVEWRELSPSLAASGLGRMEQIGYFASTRLMASFSEQGAACALAVAIERIAAT
jgi:hypothetical protein